jgi:uncharacterized protein with PQ loop repeat
VEFIVLKKIQKVFLYLIIVYAILGFIVLPLVLKPQLIKILQTQTKTKVTLSSLYFNPFLFKLRLSGLKIKNLQNKPLFSLKSLLIDVDPSSLVYGAVHIHLVELEKPEINLVRNRDKSINLINVLKQDKSHVEEKENNASVTLPRIIVERIGIEEGSIAFSDYTVADVFKFDIQNMGLRIENIDTAHNTHPKGKIRFYASLEDDGFIDLHSQIKHYEPFALHGDLDFKANKLYTEWRYVKKMLNIEVADGTIHLFTAFDFDTADINATKIDDTRVVVENLRLKPKGDYPDVLTLQNLTIGNIDAQPLKNDINISKIAINDLDVKVKRLKNGKIDWLSYVKINKKKEDLQESVKENNTSKRNPLLLNIANISLASSNITFKDEALHSEPINSINDININLHDINLKKGSWIDYTTSFKIDHKGSVTTKGKLRETPLKQIGSFKIKDISLKEITPYLQESSYVAIEDGLFSATGETSYEKSKNKPDLNLHGSLNLSSLFINDTKEKSLLFSLNSLDVKDYTLELFPNRLYVNSVNINSFYVDAEIDKNKMLNFAKLSKNKTKKVIKNTPSTKSTKKENFPFKVDKVLVALGSAKFQDFSIPLKFKTNIHNLNGVIYSLTNLKGEHTLINLHGDIDKYGSTRIEGSLDSLNPKKFTDIDMNFKNLDLSAMSGYSAAFAGYKIDSGKLFLDLEYNIIDSKLQAANKVVIKKIELGDEVADENVTHLPLGFVVGLLEDDKGVIDIDMPIDGDLNKPDFKYGKLVWNTFTNLITRAVTAPFKFLGSMLGINTDDLEYVAFESGRSSISPMQREKLDRLAVIMKKRPKLALEVSGVYDKRSDKYALQKEKLIALVLKKSGIKNKEEHQSAMTIDMLEEVYVENAKKDALQKFKAEIKKSTEKEKFVLVYREKLITACINMMKVNQKELENLAKKRVQNLVLYLEKERAIAPARVKITPKIEEVKSENGFVNLELKLNI